MARFWNVGAEIDGVLRHAKDLLDNVYEVQLDRTKHRHVFEAASTLRGKLEQLRDELRCLGKRKINLSQVFAGQNVGSRR